MFQTRYLAYATIALSTLIETTAAAQGSTSFAFDLHDKNQPFEPGHSCAELAFLTAAELKEALSPAFQSDFHAFCHPEEPQTCDEYNQSLRGHGRLSLGDDGYHCRFVPAVTKQN